MTKVLSLIPSLPKDDDDGYLQPQLVQPHRIDASTSKYTFFYLSVFCL